MTFCLTENSYFMKQGYRLYIQVMLKGKFLHVTVKLLFQKFYTTMSELKSEVEYVIKTGRQIVEKKQVDFPDKLSKQLDAIKQQYNVIGAQVGIHERSGKRV